MIRLEFLQQIIMYLEFLDKDMAEIASTQASDLIHLQKLDENEKAILRAAVQEMQMEDDEKLIIGKLHHHILSLQVSEAMALKKLKALQAKCLRLEGAVVQVSLSICIGLFSYFSSRKILLMNRIN